MFKYDEDFYKYIEQTEQDEKIIMPLIMQWILPKSIVDFGCAEGAWLREAQALNNDVDILGLDGDYVDRKRLKIHEEKFMPIDLRQNILLNRRFDLAISTEVAEHLEEEFADIFVDNIVRAADQVLFSAAIPNQGGVHHVNEKWQSYWIQKFVERGYYCDYSVRNYFWNETRISSWRRQNLLFFSKEKKQIAPERPLMDIVHPEEMIRKQKVLEKKVDHYIFNAEIPARLDETIKLLVKQNKQIVIYPYGMNGRLCEMILREKYGVEDYILADNKVAETGKNVFTAAQLKEKADAVFVIDTCKNPLIHEEVLNEIQKYVNVENIYSAFEIEEYK